MARLKWEYTLFLVLYLCQRSHQERKLDKSPSKGPQWRQAVSSNTAFAAPVCAQPLYTAVLSDQVTPGTFVLRVVGTDPNGATLQYSIQDSAFQRFSINPVTGDITVSNTLARRLTRAAVEIRVRATQTTGARLFCESTVRVNILPSAIYLTGGSGGTAVGGSAGGYGAPAPSSGGYGFPAPAPAPSVGYGAPAQAPSVSYSFPAPAPAPISYAPAPTFIPQPAPAPVYSIPAPAPVYSAPAPVPQPVYSAPAPVPQPVYSAPAPVPQPQPMYSAPAPVPQPQPVYSAPAPVPRPQPVYSAPAPVPQPIYAAPAPVPQPQPVYAAPAPVPQPQPQPQPVYSIPAPAPAPVAPVYFQPAPAPRPAPAPVYSQPAPPPPQPAPAYGAPAPAPMASYSSPGIAVSAPAFQQQPGQVPPSQVFGIQTDAQDGQNMVLPQFDTIGQGPDQLAGNGPGIITGDQSCPQPQFTQQTYNFQVSGCFSGAAAGVVSVTGDAVSYSISGNPAYTIDPSSGRITLVSQLTDSNLNQLTVTAINTCGNSGTALVQIRPNCAPPPAPTPAPARQQCTPPQFSQAFYNMFLSTCSPGTSVGTVQATSTSGGVSYSLQGGTAFSINPNSGQIQLTQQFSGTQQTLTVTARNSCGSTQATVTISANCQPQGSPPVFPQQQYSTSLTNCQPGFNVGTITANSASGGGITYTLQGTSLFSVNPNSGAVTSSTQLNSGTVTFNVIASNQFGSATAAVSINVNCPQQASSQLTSQQPSQQAQNQGCSAPVFNSQNNNLFVYSCGAGVPVGSPITASSQGGSLSYSLQGTTYFNVNPGTGQLTTASQLPSSGYQSFTVTATNPCGTSQTTVTVTAYCSGGGGSQGMSASASNLYARQMFPPGQQYFTAPAPQAPQPSMLYSAPAPVPQPSFSYSAPAPVPRPPPAASYASPAIPAPVPAPAPSYGYQAPAPPVAPAPSFTYQQPAPAPRPAPAPSFIYGAPAPMPQPAPQQSYGYSAPAPVQAPQPAPAPVYAPAPSPQPTFTYGAPAPRPAPAPSFTYAAPAPVPQPISQPLYAPAPQPVPQPIYAPAPVPQPVPQPSYGYSVPAPAPRPAPQPVYAPAPVPQPVPQPLYAPAPAPRPAPQPLYAPAPVPQPVPQPSYGYAAPAPASRPAPAPSFSYGAPAPVPAPAPTFSYSAPAPVPAPAPVYSSGSSPSYAVSLPVPSPVYAVQPAPQLYDAPVQAPAPSYDYGSPSAGVDYGYSTVASCGQQFYTTTTFESTPPGTPVLRLNGTSPSGAPLYWTIYDNPLGRFRIDSNSGTLLVAGALTRRFLRSAMEIRVRGTDYSTGQYCDSTVRINVLPDVNTTSPSSNNPPRFSQTVYNVNLPCSATTGVLVGTASATDPEGNAITYSMSSPQFTVDNSGNVRTAIPFLNSTSSTAFIILATDTGGATGSATVSVSVVGTCGSGGAAGNRPPTFSLPAYSFTIPCSTSTNQLVGTVPAFDPDGNTVTYSVSTTLFNIDTNGNIRTSVPFQSNAATSVFTIAATDSQGSSGSATVTVSISPSCTSSVATNNGLINIQQGPTCQQNLYTATVQEGTAVGTFVLRVNATSPTASTIVWSIPDNPLGRFAINPTTGDITVSTSLGRKATFRAAFEFTVRGTDIQTGLYCQSTVRINIIPNTTIATSNNPQFTSGVYFLAMQCASQAGQFVGFIVASSPTGSTLRYSMTSTEFQIDPTTGQITSIGAITTTGLRVVTVTATDANGLTSTATVQINVIGPCTGTSTITVTPTTLTSTTCVNNLTPAGTTLGTIVAAGGTGTGFTYAIVSGNFAITSPGGVLTTTTAQSGTQTATIRVTDSAGTTATVTVTATLCTANGLLLPDSSLTVVSTDARCTAGNLAAGTNLGTVAASGGTGPYTYALTPADPRFTLTPSGAITAAQALTPGTYLTTVTATDLAGATDTSVITINACVAANLVPSFTPATTVLANTASVAAGQQVLTITGTQGSGTGYTFSTTSTQFAVGATTGVVTAVSTLAPGVYSVPITVTDSLGQTSTETLTITITANAAPTTPTLTASNAALAIPSTSTDCQNGFVNAGINVGTLTTTGGTAPYTYTSQNGNFAVSAAGVVTTNAILQGPSTTQLTYTVTDAAGNTGTLTQNIGIC